jgi:ABC-type transport system involved in multi-copper enzyme maturation permease subunit
MTALAAHASASAQRISWRKLAWVTWRRQRVTLLATLAVMAGVALVLVLSGTAIHHTAARLGPGWWNQTRSAGYYSWVQNVPLVLQVLPILIGAFAGGPLLAREAESGTFRFAWTQGAGRVRLLAAQLVPMVVIVTAAAAGLGLLFAWWFAPLTGGAGMVRYSVASVDLFAPSLAGWVLFSLVFGVLAGAVIRRTVAAMGATMIGYVLLAYVTAMHLREHYLAPLRGPEACITTQEMCGAHVIAGSANLLTSFYAFPDGRRLTGQQQIQSTRWFDQHHIVLMAIYQPASRFWPFQWIELGWLSVLSLLLAGATVVIIRRRAA